MSPFAADQHEGPLLLWLWAGGDPSAKEVRYLTTCPSRVVWRLIFLQYTRGVSRNNIRTLVLNSSTCRSCGRFECQACFLPWIPDVSRSNIRTLALNSTSSHSVAQLPTQENIKDGLVTDTGDGYLRGAGEGNAKRVVHDGQQHTMCEIDGEVWLGDVADSLRGGLQCSSRLGCEGWILNTCNTVPHGAKPCR